MTSTGASSCRSNLQAANGQTYAVAQGRVMTTQDPNGAKTVGTISEGAIVEKEVVSQFLDNNVVSIILRNPDFVTASGGSEGHRGGLFRYHGDEPGRLPHRRPAPRRERGEPRRRSSRSSRRSP